MDFDELPFDNVDDNDDLPFEPVNIGNDSDEDSISDTNNKENNIEENKKDDFSDIPFENSKNDYISTSSDNINININSIFENQEAAQETDQKTDTKEKTLKNIPEKLKGALNALPIIAFSFVSILAVYIYSINAKADQINLIRFEENNKVGYINESGEVLAKAKYTSGTDFYKGYAIVKNYNNLSAIINGRAKLEVPFGNFFYVDLYKNRYIVSKFTDQGLKQGLLDSNLKEITRFKYDNISYSRSGLFLFTRDETMGIMNSDGKEIYAYEVSEEDDKNISIEVSDITNAKEKYARIKVNSSSTIINVQTGKEVYKYTLDDIYVLDNNVFYIKNEDRNNRYIVINNDKIVYETTNYKRLRIEDVNSNIAIGIKDDASIDYINLKTREVINQNENITYNYSDGVMLSSMHNFTSNKDEYKIFTPDKSIGSFTDIKLVDNTFVNGYSKIHSIDDKYSYINKKGKIITDKNYDDLGDFTSYGYATICNDNQYGIINGDGKEVVKTEYDEIVMLNEDFFNTIKKTNKEELFIFRVNERYGIINSDGKIMVKPIYDSFEVITNKYPIIKATYNGDDILINLDKFEELTMNIKKDINIYENYIVIDNKYYNYNGKHIYTAK